MIGIRGTHDSKHVFIKQSESPPTTRKTIVVDSDSKMSSGKNMIDMRSLNKENHHHNNCHEQTMSSSSTSSPLSQKITSPLRTINNDPINQNIVEQQVRGGHQRFSDENLYPRSRIVIDDSNNHYDYHNYRSQSLFDNLGSDDVDDLSLTGDRDEVGRMMPGVLEEGTAYTIKETIFQGYLEKKGSGFDWIGSRAWKRRWAVLVVGFLLVHFITGREKSNHGRNRTEQALTDLFLFFPCIVLISESPHRWPRRGRPPPPDILGLPFVISFHGHFSGFGGGPTRNQARRCFGLK